MKVSLSRRAAAARRRLSVVVWMQIGVLLIGQCSIGFANPNGGTVVSGTAAISSSGNLTTINQTSNRAIINWRGFSIGAGETTQFIQPGSNSAILNRVTGAQMSQLMGTLQANGQVFLINPNGILIGSGATINVGGFTASTLDVSNSQFMQGGDLTFSGSSTASVINQGNVTAIGGDIYLIGSHVENHGTLNAANGTVGLAAGQEVKLVDSDSQALVVRATGSSLGGTGVLNTGVINGVRAELAANGGNVYALAINNTGVVRATGAVRQNGRVLLTAPGGKIANSGNLIAKNADGSGGQVTINSSNGTSGETNVSGHIDVSGTTGGRVEVLGDKVNLIGATIDAYGTADGGVVLIGGDYRGNNPAIPNALRTDFDAASAVDVRSSGTGNGGSVVVWGTDEVSFHGSINTLGGDGGLVEVSTRGSGIIDGTATTLNMLVDPGDVVISTASTTGGAAGAVEVTASTITNVLNLGGTFTLNTDNTGTTGTGRVDFGGGSNFAVTNNTGTMGTFIIHAADEINTQQVGFLSNGTTGTNYEWYAGSSATANPVDSADIIQGAQVFNTGGGYVIRDAADDISINDPLMTSGGAVTLIARGGDGGSTLTIGEFGNTSDDGIFTTDGAGNAGAVTITADNLVLTGTRDPIIDANGSGGTVTLQPFTSGRTIDVGTVSSGSLSITAANLDRIAADVLQIGSSTSGNILVSDTLSPANAGSLSLISGGNIQFDSPLVMTGDTSLTSTGNGNITFNSTIDGLFGLTVNTGGVTLFDRSIGTTARIGDLTTDAAGSTTLQTLTLRTSGSISFNDPVTGIGGIAIDSNQGGGNTTFASTIDGGDWLIAEPSTLTFGGAVGETTAITGLQLTSPGSTVRINGGLIRVSNLLRLRGNLTFDSATNTTTLESTGGGEIRLGQSASNFVRSATDGEESLIINTTGSTLLFGVIGDNNQRFNSITTNAGGTTTLSGGSLTLAGNTLTLNDAVILGADTTITDAGAVTFNNTVDGAFALDINAGGNVTFGGVVGGTTPLTSLGVASSGEILVNNTIATDNGAINFSADDMSIAAGINAGTGIVTLTPLTAGRTIDLGTETAGSLSLTDSEIDFVTAGTLRIGSADAGSITFSDTISPAGNNTLSLITGDEILDDNNGGADVMVGNLAIQAVNGIANNALLETEVDTVAALNTTGGGIAILETSAGGNLTVGTVDGVIGLRNEASTGFSPTFAIQLETTNGDLTVNNDIFTSRRNMFIVAQQANGGNGASTFTNNANIINADSGNNANNARIDIRANNMTLSPGSTISAANRVILEDDPSSTATIAINLGGADSDTIGSLTLGLTNDELNTVSTPGVLQIGHLNGGGSGDITISAPITLTNVNTLDLETGLAVLDGTGTEQPDLTVGNLAIRSGAGIGTVGNDLNIAATNLAFNNTGGAINLHNTGALTIASLDGLATSNNSGTTTTITTASPLTFAVDTISAGTAVHTAGEISDAPTFADVLTVNPGVTVQSMTGDLTLQAGDNVVLGAGSTASAAGTLNITAGFGDLDMGGTLLIDPTANLVGDPINLTSFEDYAVDVLNVPGVTLNITSTNGAILDGNDPPDGTLNITAQNLTLNAITGIGGAGTTATLETQVDHLEAITNTGGIFVANTGNLTVGGASAGLNGVQVTMGGDIELSSTQNIIVNEEIGIAAGGGDILLLSPLDIHVNANIQNQTTGSTSLVAGWDGVTMDIATILGDHSTFGIGGGSVFIGDGNQTSGISVGSRFGPTNVAAADLTIRGSDTNSAGFAQLGFQGNGDINGPILVSLSDGNGAPGNLTIQADESYAQLGHGGRSANGNQTGDITIAKANDITVSGGSVFNAYAQLGHGGRLAFGNSQGDISIAAANNIIVSGGSNSEAYAQIGHGGTFTFGDQSGDITLGQVNDMTFTGGSHFATYAQLGHGGYATFGDQTGNITIVRANDMTFTGDDGFAAYAQLGHGGAFAFGDQTGDISTGRLNNVDFTAGSGSSAYAQFGHGGDSVFGDQTGNINFETVNDITFDGGSRFNAYAQLGHGGAGVNGDQTGDINIWRANNLFFEGGTGTNAYAQLGHGGTALFIESEGEFELQFNSLGLSLANQTGNITISQANDIFFTGGDGFASYSQLGHGGFDTIGNQTGNISVRLVGSDLFLTGGAGENAYAQLGHGAADGGATGFRTGDIRVIIDGSAVLAGGSATAPAWLGHRTNTPNGINGDLTLAIDQIDPLADNGGRLFMNQFSAIDMGGLPNGVRIFGTRRLGNTLADGAMINGVVVDSSLPPGTFTGDRWNPNFEFVTWNHEQWGWTYNQYTLAQPGPYTAPFTFYYLGVFNIFPDLPPQLTAFGLPYDRFVRYSDYADSIFQIFPNGPYRMYYGLWPNRPQEGEETGANSAHTYSDWNYSEAFGLTGSLPYE